MIVYACILSFLSVCMLILWGWGQRDRSARQRVERDLIRRNLAAIGLDEGIDDAAILKDETLSGIGPIDAFLNSLKLATNLKRLIAQADLPLKVGTLLMMMLVLGGAGVFLGVALGVGWTVAIVCGLFAGSLPYTYVVMCRKRRLARFESQFPEAIELISRSIRAGHAFSAGLKMVADEMPEPVAREFRRVFEEQNLGIPLRNALMSLLDRVDLVDLKLFVVAVLIQRQSGGNLSEILDKIAYTVRERFRILRQLKVHTAQAKLTGIILVCLPPVVGSIIFFLNYEYMKVIIQETWGLRMLAAAATLQIAGFFWIRKIVNIEV